MQLQGQGDIYGLVDFLFRLERGDKLLALDELSLNAGFGPGFLPGFVQSFGQRIRLRLVQAPQSLTWSLGLHGLYRASSGASGS